MKKLAILASSAYAYFYVASVAFAADVNPCPQGLPTGQGSKFNQLCNLKAESGNLGSIVRNLIIAIFVIATLIALFFLVWGGVRWIVSGGDKAKVEAARGTIVAAVIGLIIVFLSYFILSIVLNIFGLSLTDLQIPSITAVGP